MREWRRSTAGLGVKAERLKSSLKERIERVMDITLGREMQRLEKQMIFLASVGSSATFIGLFGTVWGIMNAFTAIAAAKNTMIPLIDLVTMDVRDALPQLLGGVSVGAKAPVVPFRMALVPAGGHSAEFDNLHQLDGCVSDAD